jgi:hypothetical protein
MRILLSAMPDRTRQSTAPSPIVPPVSAACALPDVPTRQGRRSIGRLLERLWPVEVWLGLAAFLIYLPTAARVLKLGPDVIEYLDIGKRLAAGDGFLLGVKAFHFGGTQVLHDGLAERPPLFPFMIAGLYAIGFGPLAVQVANALLTAISIALVAAIGRRLFSREVGILAAILAAASPLVLERMIWPMTEALAISLSLGATWLVLRAAERPTVRSFGGAGVLLGLAYLTRPTVAALVVALGAAAWFVARDRRRAMLPMLAYAAGTAFSVVPISVYSLLTRGSLSYSGQTYLYAVYKDPEVMEFGFNAPIPTPFAFVYDNLGLVIRTIGETFSAYAHLLFADWELMFPLALAWPGVLWTLYRCGYKRSAIVALTVAATNFVIYALTWSTFQDRYLLLTMLLLLPFAIDGLFWLGRLALGLIGPGRAPIARWLPTVVVYGVVAITAVIWGQRIVYEYRGEFRYGELAAGTRKDEGLVWTAPPRWLRDGDLPRLVNWINTRTERNEVLAHAQPWPFTFFTGRPSTLLPVNLSPERLRLLLVSYQVDYVLLDTRDRTRREYSDDLEALEDAGVTMTTLGAYQIYDVRPLHK